MLASPAIASPPPQPPAPKSVHEILGVPPPPTNGRERLVAAALELFYRHGFVAVGIDQVLARAGVNKTTFYKHFESKDELMVAAVERRDQWETAAWDRAVRKIAGDDPAGQLLALLDVMDVWFNDPEYRGCLFTNAAAEFPTPHDPVHQAAAAVKCRQIEHRQKLARAAGATDAAAEIFADCYTALIEGAMTIRLTHSRNDAARAIRPAVQQLIDVYLPKRDNGKQPSPKRTPRNPK